MEEKAIMSKVEAIIFDCDGVMFESHQANLAFYNRILTEFNYPLVTVEQKDLAYLCHTASSPVVLIWRSRKSYSPEKWVVPLSVPMRA